MFQDLKYKNSAKCKPLESPPCISLLKYYLESFSYVEKKLSKKPQRPYEIIRNKKMICNHFRFNFCYKNCLYVYVYESLFSERSLWRQQI